MLGGQNNLKQFLLNPTRDRTSQLHFAAIKEIKIWYTKNILQILYTSCSRDHQVIVNSVIL